MHVNVKLIFLFLLLFQTSVSGMKSAMWKLLLQNRAYFKTPERCDDQCADTLPYALCWVANIFSLCAWPGYERNCQFSCNVCKVCEKPIPECIFDFCTNDMVMCPTYKLMGMCPMEHMQGKCKLSCGECGPRCAFPALPAACTNDCMDEVATRHCNWYKSQGHCKPDTKWMAVRQKCKLTCGICTTCESSIGAGRSLNATTTTIKPTPAPNTSEVSTPTSSP